MSLWALLRRLPRTKGAVAPFLAASGRGFYRRHLQAQERPRPHGGATPIAFGLVLSASSLFSQEAEEETEKDATESLPEEAEEEIIFLLKKAKLCIMKRELEEAERLLHEAARLSHQSNNRNGIIYTYDTMANLAFLRGQLDHAEKLFKAAMTFLLAGNMEQDDNAIIEMSLKLASIYAAQNQEKLALAGYQFCILTLKEKIAKQKDMAADAVPEDFPQARQVYKEALKLAEEAGDGAVVRYIRKGLAELARRQKQAKSAENLAKQGNEGKD